MKTNSPLMWPVLLVLALVIAIGPIGCASSTSITSEPEGAEVRIDGMQQGQTPLTYTDDSVWLWTKHQVTVEKKGYETVNGMIKGEIVPVYMVIGVIAFFTVCFWPIAWMALIGEYRPQYHFVLDRKQALETAWALEEMAEIEFAN